MMNKKTLLLNILDSHDDIFQKSRKSWKLYETIRDYDYSDILSYIDDTDKKTIHNAVEFYMKNCTYRNKYIAEDILRDISHSIN